MQLKRFTMSIGLAAALGVAGLGLTCPPASAAASIACPDGTWVQNVKDCAKHGAVASAVTTTPSANPATPATNQSAKRSIFDRWGNLIHVQQPGPGPTNPASKPSGSPGASGELKATPGASDPMPMPMP
jgi:hypothetical protein